MGLLILKESYARQHKIETIKRLFIDRLSEFFGGLSVDNIKSLSETDSEYVGLVQFSNGSQFKINLERQDNFEVVCRAFREHDHSYINQLTDDDFEYICKLVQKRLLEVTPVPGIKRLNHQEQIEEERLLYLVPKLMIITGQAKTNNF